MASSQTGSSASYLCWTLDVGRSALATPKLSAYAGSTFFFRHGRVAESGLRHSTRNRAWGNPPWVRIPPLPRFSPQRPRTTRNDTKKREEHFRMLRLFSGPIDVSSRRRTNVRFGTAPASFRQNRSAAASYMKSLLQPGGSTAACSFHLFL